MVATGVNGRDRLLAGLGTAIVLALLGYLLVRGLTVGIEIRLDPTVALLDLPAHPPPPPRRPPPERPKPKRAAAASPANLRNNATPVVVPPPIVPPITPPPIIAAPKPNIGTAASTGASDRAGTGEGAGGEGDGSGSGGDGDGDTPPRQTKGHLKFSDLRSDLLPVGVVANVAVRYRVETDGRVTGCAVTKSSGYGEVDATTCRLIEQRFRFRPGRDRDGNPFRSTIEETHSWEMDRPTPAAP